MALTRALPAALLAALGACTLSPARVETLSQAPSFHAKVLAVAAVRGAGPKGDGLAKALARRLTDGGVRAVSLESADSVLAGSVVGLEAAGDPRVLAEIRRATDADGVVFVTVTPDWSALDVSVLDANTGDGVLRATARARGDAFDSADEAASAAAQALAGLAPEKAKAAAAATDSSDELPVP